MQRYCHQKAIKDNWNVVKTDQRQMHTDQLEIKDNDKIMRKKSKAKVW
jgi:hypothetical protein